MSPVLGVGVLLLGFFFFHSHWGLWEGWVECLVGLYFIFATPIAKILLGRRYRRTRIHQGPLTLRFEEDAIYSECPGTSSSRIEYSTIKRLYPAMNSILIYLAPAMFLVVPKRLMSDEERVSLVDLLEAKIV
jgi:hypothetical protein